MTDVSKVDLLALVERDARTYALAKGNVERARNNLFGAICAARAAKATQQEIADRTVQPDDALIKVDLSRQRIAQILAEQS